jgi:hypothetical protein
MATGELGSALDRQAVSQSMTPRMSSATVS